MVGRKTAHGLPATKAAATEGITGGLNGVALMAHFAWLDFDKTHFDKTHVVAALDRVESAIVLGLIGTGLAACALGAVVYDVERWFAAF